MKRFGRSIRGFVLAVVLLACSAGGASTPGAGLLRERHLREVKLDPAPLEMGDCPTAGELEPGTVVAVCRAPGAKGATGELHLMIVDRSGGRDRVLYRGPGAGDSSYMRPTVFDGEGGAPVVILAEAGAEFSYGIGVYLMEAGRKVRRAGEIDLGAPGEDGPTSAVPFARVERSGKGLCVRFTQDLVRPRPDGTYATVPKEKAIYKVEAGRVAPSRSCM